MINLYRKKPVTIEAVQWTGKNLNEIKAFVGDDLETDFSDDLELVILYLYAPEDKMKASIGSYIIKGVNGEFYACNPDVFAKTYEKINDLKSDCESGVSDAPAWVSRMRKEYHELKTRYEKLHRMITKYEARTLDFTPNCSIDLLCQQKRHMGEYLHDLEIRAEIEGIEL